MKIKTLVLAGVTGILLSVSTASAANVDVVLVDQAARDALDPTKSLDLSGGDWTVGRSSVTGSVGGLWRSPWQGDLAGNANTAYWTMGPTGAANQPNPGILQLPSLRTALSFLWGSVDTYNEIRFYNGATLVSTVLGQQALDDNPTPQVGLGAALVNITGIGQFDRVEFLSRGSNAFELSNISAVPIPPAILMLLSGLLGLGFLARRRSKSAA